MKFGGVVFMVFDVFASRVDSRFPWFLIVFSGFNLKMFCHKVMCHVHIVDPFQ